MAKCGPAVTVPELVLFLRQVKQLARIAKDKFISLIFRIIEGFQSGIPRHRFAQRIELLQQGAPVALALLADALRNNAFYSKRRLRRVAARGERFVFAAEKTGLREPALRPG